MSYAKWLRETPIQDRPLAIMEDPSLLSAVLDSHDALLSAAQLSARRGHHDTCSHALIPTFACDCGADALADAIAKAEKP